MLARHPDMMMSQIYRARHLLRLFGWDNTHTGKPHAHTCTTGSYLCSDWNTNPLNNVSVVNSLSLSMRNSPFETWDCEGLWHESGNHAKDVAVQLEYIKSMLLNPQEILALLYFIFVSKKSNLAKVCAKIEAVHTYQWESSDASGWKQHARK